MVATSERQSAAVVVVVTVGLRLVGVGLLFGDKSRVWFYEVGLGYSERVASVSQVCRTRSRV